MSARGCSVTGCERSYRAKGLCHLHAERLRRHGTTDLPPRKPRPEPPSPEELLAECRAAHAALCAVIEEES